ncbi:hypothetical protein V5O48_016199 [Marasmius crinis-equi]|uniref:Uncharacterized protein n=1 Tax=Marasmius crinis-equi TaxID=585013 RepID=A0ABR3ESD6_9AGAR
MVRDRYSQLWERLQSLPTASSIGSAAYLSVLDEPRTRENNWLDLGSLANPDGSRHLPELSAYGESWRLDRRLPTAGATVLMLCIMAPCVVPSIVSTEGTMSQGAPMLLASVPLSDAGAQYHPVLTATVVPTSASRIAVLAGLTTPAPAPQPPQLEWLRSHYLQEIQKMREWWFGLLYGSAYRGCRIALIVRPIYSALGWGNGGGQKFRCEVSTGVFLTASDFHHLLDISESHYSSWRTLLKQVETGLQILRRRAHLTDDEEALKAICEVMTSPDDLEVSNAVGMEAEALSLKTASLRGRLDAVVGVQHAQ